MTPLPPDSELDFQRFFELFFDHSMDLLAIAGTDGYFKRVNPSFGRVLGYSDEELYAAPMVSFMHPEDVAKTRRGISILSAGTARIASVNRYRRKDGTYRTFAWNTTPAGSLLYTLGRDITEQVETEERIRAELRESEAQVQQLQKMDAIGRLAGGVAHDFNNLLGAITMYCDLLRDDRENPEAMDDHIREIRQVAERGAALTQQLLVFSRKQVIQPQIVDLNSLIDRSKKMLSRLIGTQNRIVADLSEKVGKLRVDPGQIEQVLMNLVVNARDAMGNGGTITIETEDVILNEEFTSSQLLAKVGHYVCLSVSDTGHGMDAETRTKIFEPFFTTKGAGKGTGLGLTTVYGIVKQSGGTILVQSEPNRGTVFRIYLPTTEEAGSSLTESGRSAVPEPIPSGTYRILFAEDDDRLREGFAKILGRSGFEVKTAKNAEEAWRTLSSPSEEVHLLVTDVMMPGESGFELSKRARSARPKLRILYMSGYAEQLPDSREGMDYLQKPFDANALVSKIREILSQILP